MRGARRATYARAWHSRARALSVGVVAIAEPPSQGRLETARCFLPRVPLIRKGLGIFGTVEKAFKIKEFWGFSWLPRLGQTWVSARPNMGFLLGGLIAGFRLRKAGKEVA